MKRFLTILLILLVLLNTGITFCASNSPDFDAGYDAGYAMGIENFGKNINVTSAWRTHKLSDDFQDYILEHPKYDFNDYQDGFYTGYEEGLSGTPQKVNYARTLGSMVGNIYGYRDFQNGIKSNWRKALPSDRTIRRMFNLNMETSEYREDFLMEFKIKFQEAYEIGYEKALLDPVRTSYQQGVKDGEDLGKLLGATFGAKDFYENRHSDYTRNLPSNREIIADYSLNLDNDEYKNGFLSGFIRAYESEYNKIFREANKNETLRDEKDAYIHGKEVGKIKGEVLATDDFLQKRTNDWKRSVPTSVTIISDYNLRIQSSNYRDGFIAGFFDGYSEGYQAKFKEFSQGNAKNKVNSILVPIKGGSLNSSDNAFRLNILSGTYYNPVNLTIETIYNYNQYLSSTMIKSSDSVKVSILNTSFNLDDKKEIEISFEYYGDKFKGGIYRLVDDRWVYLPSIIEEGIIKTHIKPSSLDTPGIFSVFVDTNATVFSDARGHWAKDEINSYVRRGFIYGYSDKTFKPEINISRVEFLTILSRVYNWNLDYYYSGNATQFKDYSSFGIRTNIINYATAFGYISGYPDGTFKPNNPISYKEVEIIMRRVQNNYYFKWQDIATKMLHERKVRSNSFNNMDNKITRAEVVYMLYQLNENRY